MLRIVVKRGAGLDVHKKTVVATRMRVTEEERLVWETKTFGTMTVDLLALYDWLQAWECTHVALESTADYWKPVFNVLEDAFEVLLVNAQHVKHVPGRKTDAQDSEWLAELLIHGLLKPSFIPPKPQRELREMTRYRGTLVQERARVVNRVQKLLEGMNIKLAAVATDVLGVSGRAMLEALVADRLGPAEMAQLARGRMRTKLPELEKALTGMVGKHQRKLLALQLAHIDFLDEQVEELSAEIVLHMQGMDAPPRSGDAEGGNDASEERDTEVPFGTNVPLPPMRYEDAIALLDTAPGVDQRVAETILAELGADMRRFPTPEQAAAWSGIAPGNHESGGKRYSGRTRQGNQTLCSALTQAAWSAVRTQDTYLKSRYERLVVRRGKKRAIVAVAHSLLKSIWHMLARHEPYQDLGGDYFDSRRKESKINYYLSQLHKLGYATQIEPQPLAP
jgi:transposase